MADEAKDVPATPAAGNSAVGAVAGGITDPATGVEALGAAAGAAAESGNNAARVEFLVKKAQAAANGGNPLDVEAINRELGQLGGELDTPEINAMKNLVSGVLSKIQLEAVLKSAQPEQAQMVASAAAVINENDGKPATVMAGAMTANPTTTPSGEPAAEIDMAAAGAHRPETGPVVTGAAAGNAIVPESKAKDVMDKLGIAQKTGTGLAI
jgi:hypothetical protein